MPHTDFGKNPFNTMNVWTKQSGPQSATGQPITACGPWYLNGGVYTFGTSPKHAGNEEANPPVFIRCTRTFGMPQSTAPQPNFLHPLPFSDEGSNFVILDESNEPENSANWVGNSCVWAFLDGTTFHIATYEADDTIDPLFEGVKYHTFDITTDTWVIKAEAVHDTLAHGFFQYNYLEIRSDGDIIIAYMGDPEIIMGSDFLRGSYARRESSSWTVGISISGIDKVSESEIVVGLVRGDATSNRMHMTIRRNTDGLDPLQLSVLLNDNTWGVQNAEVWDSVGFSADGQIPSMMAFDRSGTVKIRMFLGGGSNVNYYGWDDEDDPTASTDRLAADFWDPQGIRPVSPTPQSCFYDFDEKKVKILGAGGDPDRPPAVHFPLFETGENNDTFQNFRSIKWANGGINQNGINVRIMDVNGIKILGMLLFFARNPERLWYFDWHMSGSLIRNFAPNKHIVVR